MKLKTKMIGIFICMLMLATIPLAAGMNVEDNDPEPTDIGRTIVRGFYFGYKPNGIGNKFFALRIHYTEITGTETTAGIVRLSRCNVGQFTGGFMRGFGIFGFFGYMAFATFKGGIEVV
jgi:hypothetical protein